MAVDHPVALTRAQDTYCHGQKTREFKYLPHKVSKLIDVYGWLQLCGGDITCSASNLVVVIEISSAVWNKAYGYNRWKDAIRNSDYYYAMTIFLIGLLW